MVFLINCPFLFSHSWILQEFFLITSLKSDNPQEQFNTLCDNITYVIAQAGEGGRVILLCLLCLLFFLLWFILFFTQNNKNNNKKIEQKLVKNPN